MCECEEGKCTCSNEQSCGCGKSECCGEEQYDKADMFLYMAKGAKMELLKEKMKKRLEAAEGKKLDKVADLIVEALLERYKTDEDISKKRQELSEKLDTIFSED